MTIPLIIDTDVALGVVHGGRPRDVDDAYAIVTALNAPDIDLLGVTTVFGNAPLALADAVARKSSLRVMLILDSRNVIPLPVPPRRRKRASAHAAPARTSAATHAYRGNQMRRTRDRCGGDRALSSGGLHPPAGGQASDTAAGVSVPSAGTAAGA